MFVGHDDMEIPLTVRRWRVPELVNCYETFTENALANDPNLVFLDPLPKYFGASQSTYIKETVY